MATQSESYWKVKPVDKLRPSYGQFNSKENMNLLWSWSSKQHSK